MSKRDQIKTFFLTDRIGYHVTKQLNTWLLFFLSSQPVQQPSLFLSNETGKIRSHVACAVVEVHYRSIHPRIVLATPQRSAYILPKYLDSWIFRKCRFLVLFFFFFFFFFLRYFVKREPYQVRLTQTRGKHFCFQHENTSEVMIALFRVF